LASYAIEAGSSRTFAATKSFMYNETAAWHALMDRLAELTGRYLAAQVRAGAGAVQLFDSWIGCLAPEDYRTYVQPHSRRTLELARQAGAPVIHFGTGTAGFLEDFAAAGGDVIGIDWRMPLDAAWGRLGPAQGIQGNLDPLTLFAPSATLEARVRDIVARAARRPGHIFNLGHGVLPDTPIEALQTVVELVHGC
jgi:uroporphyrinogen decarboxylase